jgi:cysteine-rich repeat protein
VTLSDLLASSDGNFWDTLVLPVTIPAGVSNLTVEIISGTGTDCPTGSASLNWVASALEVPPAAFCGDGVVDPGEECDDGNDDDFDGCRNDCTTPICGDGIVDDGELCDDGNDDNFDGCRNDCSTPACGDGIVDFGEECDDGNDIDDDECRNNCTAPFCGDGIVDPGEECDDGNNDAGDGCSPTCTTEGGGEGCTPGYWKQPQHFDSWTGYSPTDSFNDVFGVEASGNPTLLQALRTGGGGANALGRHAVAAILNSSAASGVAYLYSTADVINLVQEAYATGEYEDAKDLLAGENEQGCPLN